MINSGLRASFTMAVARWVTERLRDHPFPFNFHRSASLGLQSSLRLRPKGRQGFVLLIPIASWGFYIAPGMRSERETVYETKPSRFIGICFAGFFGSCAVGQFVGTDGARLNNGFGERQQWRGYCGRHGD